MPSRGEVLFSQIIDRAALDALIGEPEDGNLDCKEWPAKEKDGHEMLAKVVCGLTNSDGGVLVIGMQAKQLSPGDPDVITAVAPVPDASYLRSRILTLIGMLVEPPIVGIETREISETSGSKSGFVIVHVPRSDGPPHRFALGLKNVGRGIARFPAIWFSRTGYFNLDLYGIDGNFNYGLPLRPSESTSIIFGGGVDDVLYPEQQLMIAKLTQFGINTEIEGIPVTMTPYAGGRQLLRRFVFSKVTFECSISCDGQPTETVQCPIGEDQFIMSI